MKYLIQITVFVVFSMAGLCSADSQIPQVRVQGQYAANICPDRAILTLKITGKGHCAKAAAMLQQKYIDNTFKILAESKINRKEITLAGPCTGTDGAMVSVATIPVVNISKLPDLIQSFSTRPGIQIDQLAWTHTRLAQLEADAVAVALKDAKQKAQSMATALGSSLGEALLIHPMVSEKKKVKKEMPFLMIEKRIEVAFRLVPL